MGGLGRGVEAAPKALVVLFDRRDPAERSMHAGLAHFDRIDDRPRGLLLERFCPAVPELRLAEEGVQDGHCVALTDGAIDADRGGPAVGESPGGIVTGTARHGSVAR